MFYARTGFSVQGKISCYKIHIKGPVPDFFFFFCRVKSFLPQRVYCKGSSLWGEKIRLSLLYCDLLMLSVVSPGGQCATERGIPF